MTNESRNKWRDRTYDFIERNEQKDYGHNMSSCMLLNETI